MKVMHISSALTWRGGEQQIAYLIEGLTANGFDNFVFCAANSAMQAHCEKNNISFFSYRKKGGVSFSVARALSTQAKNNKVDLLHMHDAHAHTYAIMAATFFNCSTKMVLSRRVDFPIKTSFFTQRKYNHSSIKKIICVSQFIEKLVRKGVKRPERVMTIHSGIDSSRFLNRTTGELQKILNIEKETPLVGNIAALAPHKDHFTFVDAAEKILIEKPTVKFVILGGDGGTKDAIEKYIEDKNLDASIHLLGFRNDIPELIGDIGVFLFSSKTEGLGTAVIDAVAAKLPIVTTNAGGIPEIIQHLENGWLAEVGDSASLAEGVIYALDQPRKTKAWIESGTQKLAQFDKVNMSNKTAEVYKAVLSLAR